MCGLLLVLFHAHWTVPLLSVRFDSDLLEHVEEVGRSRSHWSLEVPKVSPRSRHWCERMMVRHLQHHTDACVIVEGQKKGNDVAHVVDDVVRGDNIGVRCRAGHVRPEALNRRTGDPVPFGVYLEHHQHLGLLIHPNHVCCRRRQRESGNATAAADVEHGTAIGHRFTRPIVRRRGFNDVRNLKEHRRMNPWAFFRGRQYVGGQRPGVKRSAPALSR